MSNQIKMTLINSNLRRYTFQSPKIKEWVEDRSTGLVLNLFAGPTLLNLNEVRNDFDLNMPADMHLDALDFVLNYDGPKFDTIILDPPYSYRKAMEMYKQQDDKEEKYGSKFKRIADQVPNILNPEGTVISFGYHSTFLGKKRNFNLKEMCVFAHGGAQHCTIAIIEQKINDDK